MSPEAARWDIWFAWMTEVWRFAPFKRSRPNLESPPPLPNAVDHCNQDVSHLTTLAIHWHRQRQSRLPSHDSNSRQASSFSAYGS
eukprot:34462-Eustigmatos_ZCMA.PRE.1